MSSIRAMPAGERIARSARRRLSQALVLVLALGIVGTAGAVDEKALVGIKHLVREARYDEALPRIDTFLTTHPEHAEVRFLKGLVLVEQGRSAEAEAVFNALARDYPALPEPHNNLAVLYAADGDYAAAREALLMAIKTHPSYATAHENLGDIYARMAGVAYGKALEIDLGNDTARAKLAMVDELFSPRGPGGRGSPPAMAASQASDGQSAGEPAAASATQDAGSPEMQAEGEGTAAQASDQDQAQAKAEAGGEASGEGSTADAAVDSSSPAATDQAPQQGDQAPAPAGPPAEQVAESVAAASVAQPEVEQPQAEPTATAPATGTMVAAARDVPLASDADDRAQRIQEVHDTLSAWAQAWAAQDADAYIEFYGAGFEPAAGLSRAHWQIQRRTRITSPDFIRVAVSDVDVDLLDANHASVIFSQHYRSDSYRDTVRKTMTLTREGSTWKITSETALD